MKHTRIKPDFSTQYNKTIANFWKKSFKCDDFRNYIQNIEIISQRKEH